MAVRLVTWSNSAALKRVTSLMFPDSIVPSACKKVTHRYVEHTAHGVQYYDVSFNLISRVNIAHEACVSSKTNKFNDFAMENAARSVR